MGYTQGKCNKCKVAYAWKGKPKLRDAYCPICGEPLKRTSYLLKYPRVDLKV